jgi:hypothetical protein
MISFILVALPLKKGASYLEMVVMNLVSPKAAVKREFLFSINLDSNWMGEPPKNFSYWLSFTHMVLSLKRGFLPWNGCQNSCSPHHPGLGSEPVPHQLEHFELAPKLLNVFFLFVTINTVTIINCSARGIIYDRSIVPKLKKTRIVLLRRDHKRYAANRRVKMTIEAQVNYDCNTFIVQLQVALVKPLYFSLSTDNYGKYRHLWLYYLLVAAY